MLKISKLSVNKCVHWVIEMLSVKLLARMVLVYAL